MAKSRAGTGTLPKLDEEETETTESSNPKVTKKTSKPRATATAKTTTTKAAAPKDPFTASIKEFDKVKPKADIYIQMNYQSLTITVGQSVKSEFFEVLSAGAERAGLTYSRYQRIVYLNGITPNYDSDAILTALENVADYYNLKVQMSPNQTTPNTTDLQHRIENLVHSLLPAVPQS